MKATLAGETTGARRINWDTVTDENLASVKLQRISK